MAKLLLTTSVVVLIFVLAGCNGVDTGRAQMLPTKAGVTSLPAVDTDRTGEAELAEQLAVGRQAYRRGLEALVRYYTKTGNNMKLGWAKKELNALNTMARYDYIVEASVAGADLKASSTVSDADSLYNEAVRLEEQAGQFLLIKDDNLLRMALDKYNQLISKYPTSDKIDDAAFRAAGIYEHFKDYTLAVLYYQRTFQWDPDTLYPARYKAAFILDTQLYRRDEALRLYQEALSKITRADEHPQWEALAQRRIKELLGEKKPGQP